MNTDPPVTALQAATEGSEMADLAAKFLIAPTAMIQLSLAEAHVVVGYMQPQIVEQGTVFIREGDVSDTGFMMLLLDGEVTVESQLVSRAEPIILSVQGRGSLIGELGMLDHSPRYASCVATTTLRCAILTREALQLLMEEHPLVTAKLLLAVSLRVAERLRERSDTLKMYVQLMEAMQQEIVSRESIEAAYADSAASR